MLPQTDVCVERHLPPRNSAPTTYTEGKVDESSEPILSTRWKSRRNKRRCRKGRLARLLEDVPRNAFSVFPMFVPRSDKSSDMVYHRVHARGASRWDLRRRKGDRC